MINEEPTTKALSLYSENSKMAFIDTITISPVLKSFFAGSVSGTCSTILFQPLDLVKTKLQAIHIGSGTNPIGMFAIVGNVVKQEQIFGLWRGMTPSIVRCVPGVGLYFSSLHWLKTTFCKGSTPLGPLQAIALGGFARTLTGVTMIPFTVIKTRFESGVYTYRGIGDAIRLIYAGEGVRGFTCGLLPTLLRDAPFSGLYLMFYTQTKKIIPEEIVAGHLAPPLHFCCGIVAGILASGVTQPFDVLKTKMQLYPNKFENIYHAAIYVNKKYGPQGYFKGLVPRMMRRTMMAALAWTVYEHAMKSLALK